MAEANPSKYTVNSDFPMPAQTSQRSVTVNIPSGVSNGGASQANGFSQNIEMGEGTQIIRMSIKSSRTGAITVGNRLIQYYEDGTFVAFFQNIGNNTVKCTVLVTSGYDVTKTTTGSQNNFTFNLSGFKLP